MNHCSMAVDRSPERVWAALDSGFYAGGNFARAGYKVEPLNEPALPLGGYRLWREQGGSIDERICGITERDASAMRISMRADYLSRDAKNMIVLATYRAESAGETAVFLLDCHSTLDFEVAANASREDVMREVAELRDHFDQGIAQGMARMKAWIEET